MYKTLLKPIAFLIDPERAHHLTLRVFKISLSIPILSTLVKSRFNTKKESKGFTLWGLSFKNRVGLAAGFDKDGKHYGLMQHVGFGFIEIGTVTPLPQIGNPRPRLFRLPKDQALINRMGFNNDGVDAMVRRLKKNGASDIIIGGNIGKNKITPNSEAKEDYRKCFKALQPYVDYFVVNVSSPNTPGLRELQEKGPLTEILNVVHSENNSSTKAKPILLKIAPDLTWAQIDDVLEIIEETGTHGIIATNTTIDRSNLTSKREVVKSIGNGGVSGKPLANKSTQIIHYIAKKTKHSLPIIAVGGIDSPAAAKAKIEAGASLVQIYSGLIYKGPGLIKRIVKSIG